MFRICFKCCGNKFLQKLTVIRKKSLPSTLLIISFLLILYIKNLDRDNTTEISREKNMKTELNFEQILNIIENNSVRCEKKRMPTSDDIHWSQRRWQADSSKSKIFLYSAYYDDRPMSGLQPHVRIILMGRYKHDMKMFCHLWYDDHQHEAYVEKGELNETGMNRMEFNDGYYFEYTLSCPVPFSNPIPKYVSVTQDEICKSHQTLLPVFYEYHQEPPIEFGVCVVNGHGHFNAEEMVEWFEFYRLMGVKEFNLYNTSYEGVDDVFDYYIKNNVLVLSQIPHPKGIGNERTYSYEQVRNLRITSLNDCMMRNMYRYRYLVIVDHDEFIVPRMNITNYHDLIAEVTSSLKVKEEIMSIGFYNTYFFKTFPPDLYKPKHMKTLRHRYRTNPLGGYVGSKSIIRPTFCFNLMNHYCYVRLPLYKGVVSYFSPEELALIHHYRICGRFITTSSCSELHAQKTADDTILKFENQLQTSTDRVLLHLKDNL